MLSVSETHIVSLLANQDQQAVSHIYDQYGGALYGAILRLTNDEAVASDILQEALIKIWKQGTNYDASKAKLFTWMMRICRNSAIDRLRSEQSRDANKIQIATSYVYTETSTSFKPEHMDVPDRVNDLDQKYRDVIDALYFKGFTQQEASEALGLPLGTVKTRLKIALRELRKVFVDPAESL